MVKKGAQNGTKTSQVLHFEGFVGTIGARDGAENSMIVTSTAFRRLGGGKCAADGARYGAERM